jgi:hypothetical protein
LLELRVADPLATTKAIVLRETIMLEYGAISYETIIGTEENPKEQAASATFKTLPLVLLTSIFKYGNLVYFTVAPLPFLKVTQYQD